MVEAAILLFIEIRIAYFGIQFLTNAKYREIVDSAVNSILQLFDIFLNNEDCLFDKLLLERTGRDLSLLLIFTFNIQY